MKKKSNYILFDNPDKKTKPEISGNKLIIDTDNPRLRLVDALNLGEDLLKYGFFRYRYAFSFGDCDASISIAELKHATYIEVEVTGKTQNKIVKCLEYFQSKMEESNADGRYIIINSYDYVSEYYCNKMYPKLNELERNLRKLLFNTYTLNYGLAYYEPTISDELLKKGKRVIKSDNKKANGNEVTKELFYSFDYGQIHQLLFTPQWTDLDEKRKNEFLEKNEKLSELSEDELRNAFTEFVPKSDWERLFAGKVSDDTDVNLLLSSIRSDRNRVAHCKSFGYEDYKACNNNIKKLNSALLKAIEITETIDFSMKSRESLLSSLESVRKMAQDFAKNLAPALTKISEYASTILTSLKPTIEMLGRMGTKLAGLGLYNYSNYDDEDIIDSDAEELDKTDEESECEDTSYSSDDESNEKEDDL